MHSEYTLGKRRWLDRPEMLIAAAGGALVSALLLLMIPSMGTLLLEILVGLVMVGRAWLLRRRERAAAQLCLASTTPGNRFRLPDRYELVLIITIMLSYRAIGVPLRTVRAPEVFIRIAPLLLFAAGLLAKNHILHAMARGANRFRGRLAHSETGLQAPYR
jgi:glucose dehydrogenase